MKLGLDPRLPIQGGQDYSKQLYTRLYDIFRSHAAAVNAVDEAGAQNATDISTNTAAIAQNATDIAALQSVPPGVPGITFAAINALTSDVGSRICTDQDGILYAWSAGQAKYVAQVADNQTALARASSTTLLTPAALGFAEQPVKTGSAQFVRATNEILMSGIVTDLGLEVGDVIQISGSASNNFTMTVEVITDANDINVNYEHRNGAGLLSLTNETATCTIKRIAKWYNAAFGLGQQIVNVGAHRGNAVLYTNSTQRSIMAYAYGNSTGTGSYLYVDRGNYPVTTIPGGAPSGNAISVSITVPPGGVYRWRWGGGLSVVEISEIR